MAIDFMDVTEGNRRRQALLQKLMAQAGGNSANVQAIARLLGSRMGAGGRGGAVRAMPLFGGGRTARNAIDLPPANIPQLTVPFPIAPNMADQLGPGGAGRSPAAGEWSPSPGVPAADPSNQGAGPGPSPGQPAPAPWDFNPNMVGGPGGISYRPPAPPAQAGAIIRRLLGVTYTKPRASTTNYFYNRLR